MPPALGFSCMVAYIGTDIVDSGLIVLFSVFFFCYFSVFFPLPSSPCKFFYRRPWVLVLSRF